MGRKKIKSNKPVSLAGFSYLFLQMFITMAQNVTAYIAHQALPISTLGKVCFHLHIVDPRVSYYDTELC